MQKHDNASAHLSKEYDSKIHSTIPYYENFHQEIINLIKSMDIESNTWLDTGCGTGTFVQKALMSFKNTQFILADPSEGMLNESKEKLAEYGERIKLLEPIPSQKISIKEKMDIITAIQSHHYMSKE
ncbi:class I SAM-dependent methyltransferase [Methanobacterium oryzae]|uniref:class I SAM-dependent methyltransferase n=1 Tax=Methanobacterium oryzae TaxID=69540 RepID=UPI003D2262FB